MKICVLDGGTLRQSPSAWKQLYKLGDIDFYDHTVADDSVIYERSKDADVILTNKVVLGRELICSLSKLKLVSTLATGYNQVDVQAARECGVTVCNVPAYSTEAVAQQVIAYILHFTNQVALHNDMVQSGKWAKSSFFSFWESPIRELHTMSVGVVGYGEIGRRVAMLARAFGANVNVFSRTKYEDSNVTWMDLDELLRVSDIVTLHCPLTPQTQSLMSYKSISLMKKGAYLINTSRGNVVESQALVDALESDILAGAAVDVVSEEPMSLDHPYNGAKNLVVTPHMGWAGVDALSRLIQITVDNIQYFINGKPQNCVNE